MLEYNSKAFQDYIISISSIHSVEAKHSAWINADVREGAAWSTAFDVRDISSRSIHSEIDNQ
jgi:hypothetical protein